MKKCDVLVMSSDTAVDEPTIKVVGIEKIGWKIWKNDGERRIESWCRHRRVW